jgi:pSer/pThr/pTyr-binding forkhead associated (FHA) protein
LSRASLSSFAQTASGLPSTDLKGDWGVKRHIRLRGVNGAIKGRLWESTGLLRVGRLDTLEVVLDDTSVSRHRAEMWATDRGWRISDLGSTNGTRLNGVKIGQGQ